MADKEKIRFREGMNDFEFRQWRYQNQDWFMREHFIQRPGLDEAISDSVQNHQVLALVGAPGRGLGWCVRYTAQRLQEINPGPTFCFIEDERIIDPVEENGGVLRLPYDPLLHRNPGHIELMTHRIVKGLSGVTLPRLTGAEQVAKLQTQLQDLQSRYTGAEDEEYFKFQSTLLLHQISAVDTKNVVAGLLRVNPENKAINLVFDLPSIFCNNDSVEEFEEKILGPASDLKHVQVVLAYRKGEVPLWISQNARFANRYELPLLPAQGVEYLLLGSEKPSLDGQAIEVTAGNPKLVELLATTQTLGEYSELAMEYLVPEPSDRQLSAVLSAFHGPFSTSEISMALQSFYGGVKDPKVPNHLSIKKPWLDREIVTLSLTPEVQAVANLWLLTHDKTGWLRLHDNLTNRMMKLADMYPDASEYYNLKAKNVHDARRKWDGETDLFEAIQRADTSVGLMIVANINAKREKE